MNTNLYLYTSALRDFLRPRRIAAWLIVALILGAGAMQWSGMMRGTSVTEEYGQITSILTFRMLALASAVFSTAVVSQEVEQKTIVYLLTRPIPRWKLLLGRTLASITAVWLVSAVACVAVSVGVFGGGAGLTNPALGRDLATLALGAAAYGGLFVFFSLIINRSMLVCLIYAFGWETATPNMGGYLYYLSIYSHLQSIADHPAPPSALRAMSAMSGALGGNTLAVSTALSILGGFVVFALGLSMWWFSRFEFVPREDAG